MNKALLQNPQVSQTFGDLANQSEGERLHYFKIYMLVFILSSIFLEGIDGLIVQGADIHCCVLWSREEPLILSLNPGCLGYL